MGKHAYIYFTAFENYLADKKTPVVANFLCDMEKTCKMSANNNMVIYTTLLCVQCTITSNIQQRLYA